MAGEEIETASDELFLDALEFRADGEKGSMAGYEQRVMKGGNEKLEELEEVLNGDRIIQVGQYMGFEPVLDFNKEKHEFVKKKSERDKLIEAISEIKNGKSGAIGDARR
jgi:hypothetical protein